MMTTEKKNLFSQLNVSLGNVLTIATLIVSAGVAYANFHARIVQHETDLKNEIANRIETDRRHELEISQWRNDLRGDLQDIRAELKSLRESLRKQ